METIVYLRMTLGLVAGVAMLSLSQCQPDISWAPKKASLMTHWAKDITPANVHAEYPRPQLVRSEWQNLNGLWQFSKSEDIQHPPPGKNLRRKILVPFPIESALSGIMEKTKYAWYRRTFSIPKTWEDKNIILHFGAVDWEAVVFVNGQEAGRHRGGYDAFSFDITAYLKSGGEQALIVGVFDPTDDGLYPRGKQVDEPNGIYYTSVTGIWQTVWLEPVNAAHIEGLTIIPDADQNSIQISARCPEPSNGYRIRVTASDRGKVLGQGEGAVGESITVAVPDARLWSPEAPSLYDLQVRLLDGTDELDRVSSYFALRKISLGKDTKGITRLMLNNEFVFQKGPLDQGYWPDGLYTAPSDEALKYDIEVAKDLGFNMIRKHVKIEPQRWYYWCDRLGMLVWQDMPSVHSKDYEQRKNPDYQEQFETELKQMIAELYNHPSIIMWVVFNEGWGQYDTERLTAMVKAMDPHRLVNNASGWTDKGVGDVIDIHKYPGPAAPMPEENRAAVLGEFGGLGLPVKGHTWTSENWGYQNLSTFAELNTRYEELYEQVWNLKDNPGLSAVVYTQTTDVETETNGWMTYDREVIKLKMDQARKIHSDAMVSIPVIHSAGALFLDELSVTLSNRKGENIHYTLDGSEPTAMSPVYKEKIIVTETSELKARSFDTAGNRSGLVRTLFTKATFRPAEKIPENPENGLTYHYYEGLWNQVPDFNTIPALDKGITATFDLSKRRRDERIGLKFEGIIKVPADGIYTFYTESNDGSKLFIGEKEVVNNDGPHGMEEKSGQIALKTGYHSIMVTYFQTMNKLGLIVRYQGPGVDKQEIPAGILFH